jgi:hypothetical protein
MAKKRDIERAPLIMTRTRNGLSPVSAFEAELLERYAIGAELEILVKQKRSLPELRLYWKMLNHVNEATEAYPTAEHMHEALKLHLGYTTTIRLLDGSEALMADSCAFAAMDREAFKTYFRQAKQALAERLHIEPLSFMEERERAA